MLCVGALVKHKDHQTLLHAWAEVEQHNHNASLFLAGDGPERDELLAMQAKLKLQRVHFLGFIENIRATMAASDIIVQSSNAEGLSSSVCEAQWLGKPAAVTSAGGLAEAVKHDVTGMVSPVADSPALAANLLRLINDRQYRLILAQSAARRAAAMFRTADLVQQHLLTYQQAIQVAHRQR